MADRYSVWKFLVLIVGLTYTGCRANQAPRDADYADLHQSLRLAWHLDDSPESVVGPVASHLEGAHPVDDYVRHALSQNPEIQAARKRIEAFAYQVPVAASLQDPVVGITLFPEQVQTAAGQQELSLSASQKLPWRGKLQSRSELAESQTNVARAELAAVELATIAKVKRSYYQLYFIQQAISVTQADRELLLEILEVANARYIARQVNQQDVLRAELEVANVERELVQLRQQLTSAQARMARLLHVAPETDLRALDTLPPQSIPENLNQLQQTAIAARPELHAQLASLERDRRAVELARLDYFPDLTLGATWIDVATAGISPVANGRDSVLLTAGFNVPIYRRKLDASVRSAEAKAVSTAREYDALRDETTEQLADLFAQAQSQNDLLVLFEQDILPKARQTLDVSRLGYDAGEVDFLQLVDNWRQVLKYEVSYRRLEASLRQSMAELERLVGGLNNLPLEAIPAQPFDAEQAALSPFPQLQ